MNLLTNAIEDILRDWSLLCECLLVLSNHAIDQIVALYLIPDVVLGIFSQIVVNDHPSGQGRIHSWGLLFELHHFNVESQAVYVVIFLFTQEVFKLIELFLVIDDLNENRV